MDTFKTKLAKVNARITELYDKFRIDTSLLKVDDKVRNMSKEDCEVQSMMLSGTAFFMQQEVNRLKSKINFSQTLINRAIYQDTQNHSGSWNSQYYKALNENSYCLTIHDDVMDMQVDLDALEYITHRIEAIAQTLLQIARGKR